MNPADVKAALFDVVRLKREHAELWGALEDLCNQIRNHGPIDTLRARAILADVESAGRPCHCASPFEPSATCPVHGIKRGEPVTFINADGSVTGGAR